MNISDITIVIVSYYRGSRLNRCLDTIKDVPNIIVWDNNTTGEELELVKQAEQNHPNVKFIYSPENVGLTRAWNQGIINSETDWVLITCDDMLFDEDWFEILNNILEERSSLEQIHLNAWNAIVLHKQTIVRMGWWDERYRYYPSMEDDDWYLRTVECLGYSPYGTYANHFNFPDWYLNKLEPYLKLKQELFNDPENFTYYTNSDHSPYKIIGLSTITGQDDDAGSRNNGGGSLDRGNNMTGIEFHHHKWTQITNPDELVNDNVLLAKDGRIWKRNLPDLDFYPDVRNEYAKKYFNIDLYEN